MNFALLGDDPAVLPLVRALATHSRHRLIRLVGPRAAWSSAWLIPPAATSVQSWEELLIDKEVEIVIVAGKGDEWQPIVRQLVQADRAVIVLPALAQSIPFFYELALVAAEHPGKIFPLFTWRAHPLLGQLREFLSSHEQRAVHHVQVERRPASEESGAAEGLMTGSDIDRALLVDIDLLGQLFGSYDQVTASRSGSDAGGYSLATVTLAGQNVPQAAWSATAGTAIAETADWKMTVAGEGLRAVLTGDPTQEFNNLRLDLDRESTLLENPPTDGAADLLEQLTAPAGSAWWQDLARDVELVEAVGRSVRRRRAIDVHFETPSERSLFKTQMTAAGCSLLMLTLVAVVLYLVLAATIDMPELVKKILVGLAFLPLGVFLLLQVLVFIARPAGGDRR
jgi:predicted dehydrogenase